MKSGKEKSDRKKIRVSIRFKFTMITVGVLTAVIFALCLLNATQLEKFTIQKKQSRICETITAIKSYVDSGYDDESMVFLEKMIQNSNIDVVILNNLDSVPQVLYASDINQGGKTSKLIGYIYGNSPVATEIYDRANDFMIYKSYDTRLGSYQMDCIGLYADVGYVMTTPLESIRESAELSNQFLVFLGVIAIVFGAILVYLVSASLTKPIKELSQISEQMAELNFDARYVGNQKNEIGILGESMNHMSDNLREAIEELRTANAQLEKDLKEKERIDEMRRLFLSNVSHELKTPIALVQGYAEGLKEGISEDPESMEFYCDVIIDEAHKMNLIVKRLLNLDEIESGHMQMTKETFNLSEVIRGVAQSSKMLNRDDQCKLVLDMADEIPIYADEFMIEQVIQNYMSNAYHYVSPGGTVTVRAYCKGTEILVSVHNTGDPIPEEDLDHVWEKFYKVDKARTRSYGGSGIGLSIVKAIINNHEGRCGVLNRDGGVEFWFALDAEKKEAISGKKGKNEI
ncbi:MAG: ATP-binding protein [Clostridiales bacterium]|nr:ATP-binding protein [Clostridiales bacterium]